MKKLQHKDRVHQGDSYATVIDVHDDGVHISVLPDRGPRELVVWEIDETEQVI
jgi:hypothetical protein